MNTVVNKTVCKCGAITLTFNNGAVNSMLKKTYNKLPQQYHNQDNKESFVVWACDHCVNHYGIDKPDGKGGYNQTLEVIQLSSIFPMADGTQMAFSRNMANAQTIELYENGEFDAFVKTIQ